MYADRARKPHRAVARTDSSENEENEKEGKKCVLCTFRLIIENDLKLDQIHGVQIYGTSTYTNTHINTFDCTGSSANEHTIQMARKQRRRQRDTHA